MFVVDTNIMIYAAVEEFSEHDDARRLIEQWRRGSRSWFATWPILYEFLRVVTHRSVFERPLKLSDAWSFVDRLFEASSFSLLVETNRHGDVLAALMAEYPRITGNILHDLHTAALMKEHGVTEIRSADADFHQFRFLRVVNPLSAP